MKHAVDWERSIPLTKLPAAKINYSDRHPVRLVHRTGCWDILSGTMPGDQQMGEMDTHSFSFHISDDGKTVEGVFQVGSNRHDIYYRCISEDFLFLNDESFLAAAILPCMKAGGGELISKAGVSQQFLSGLSTIQDIFCVWKKSLHRVKIRHPSPVEKKKTGNRAGVFFSGGVDSFYTFLKNQDEITDLIFIHGADIRLNDTKLRDKTSKNIRSIASAFGKRLVEIETNIRELLNPYVGWGALSHGAALASVGHLLSPQFRRIYIASSHTYLNMFPWGSHPVLDPLWSSDALEFIHDGCEATRVGKVSLIAKHEAALQYLRVCTKNPDSSYNCGRCEKCVRTMINLLVNNALEKCPAFDSEFDMRNVLKIYVANDSMRSFIVENLEALEESQGHDELKNALKKVLSRPMWPYHIKRRLFKSLKKMKKRIQA